MTHEHTHSHGIRGWIEQVFHVGGHSHEPAAFNASREGSRVVWLALLALGVTSILQIGIVALSGSVALLADTIHNVGDTLNSIPLLIAFYLARRAATRRYTYGFGRAEDVAGVLIVLSIAVSSLVVFGETIQKLLHPQPMQNIGWVAAAAIIGFLGNETVALLQIRAGRKIGSEAMIADGLHARIDGLTSLAVLIAAAGSALGLPILDPIIGLLMGVMIVFITRDAALRIWYRLMDAVDPALVSQIEHYASEVAGVEQVARLRVRWVGHELFAEMTIRVQAGLTLAAGDQIVANVEGSLSRAIPHLREVTIRVEPSDRESADGANSPIAGLLNMLPPRYQLSTPSAAPMGAAALKFDAEGGIAWDQIWTDFCDLALAGGPPHRRTLLEPVGAEAVADPAGYARVIRELERGIHMVTGLAVVADAAPGWIGMECQSEAMALWLLRAIVVENVSVRREGNVLYFPAGPDFRVEKEIKNVITVIAKTTHYWKEHAGA